MQPLFPSLDSHFSQVRISMLRFLFLLCCIPSLGKRAYALSYNTCSPRLPGWPLHLRVPLPPWNSKDKKCCLYDTPYVAASVRVLGDVIAKLYPTRNFLWTHLQDPLGSWVTWFWGDPSRHTCHIKNPTCILYKEVYKQMWYQKGLLITLEKFHNKYLQVFHLGYSALRWCHEHNPQKPWRLRWLREKDTEQSALTQAHHTHCAPRQLGTTADWRYDVPRDWRWDACQLARVHWGTCCEGFCSKESLHYCIERSARNPLERDQVQRALGKLFRSCHRTSNNQPWFTNLEIPWGFLAWAVLCWLSGGLCHARKCQLEDIVWEEKVWFTIAQRTFAWETFGKRRIWEMKPVVSLLPDSHKCLALRKCMMCARNLGARVQCSTSES